MNNHDPRLQATCYVDSLGASQWEVTVWNRAEPEDRRVYTISGKSDNEVANKGLDQFVDEMIALYDT